MPLTAGTRLGSYEIVDSIGAGGMGEVYRARDTSLQRHVAIKIVPELFATDPERLARFTREAQTLAALNHPNIAQIYGLEGTALVMELVEGEDLAERLSRGPIGIEDALPIAKQVAEGLAAAHDQGIIHRDLKPANIRITPDGTVKVLDFGLAKAAEPPGGSSAMTLNSPTFTSPATQMGVILGTAAYMSPEQARGRPVDKRTDIWAFGCVLFEMLTGRMAFAGDNITDTLAAVVRGEPDWTGLPGDTSPAIQRLLARCLTKDPKERLSDIGVARLEIRDALGQATPTPRAAVPAPARARVVWWQPAVAFLAGVLVTAVAAWMLSTAPPAALPLNLPIDWPTGIEWAGPAGPGLAISPDGTRIAYTASRIAENSELHVQSLVTNESHLVSSTERPYNPFFSPDGTQIGFISAGKLWRAPVAGGTPFEIGTIDQASRGTSWSRDGYIYSGGSDGLSRIPESGGTRETLTSVDRSAREVAHRFPTVIPGGRGILFTVFRGGLDQARVAVLDLSSRKWTPLNDQSGFSAQYVATGHVVYLRNGVLMAVPFDARKLTATGTAAPVLQGVLYNNGGAGHYSVSETGTLAYVPEPDNMVKATLAWADRTGRTSPIEIPAAPYRNLALSPDGKRVALQRRDGPARSSIVVWDFERRQFTPITRDSAVNEFPVWTPDGQHIVFTSRSQLGTVGRLFRQRADGAGSPVQISSAPIEQRFADSGELPGSLSRDGKKLFFTQVATSADGMKVLDLASGSAETILPLTNRTGYPRISPDGRWLAYRANETGISEIYLRPYPDVNRGQWVMSNGGGYSARWSRDGGELFFKGIGVNRSRIYYVSLDKVASPQSAHPQVLFDVPWARPFSDAADNSDFDVAADGRLLLLILSDAKPPVPHVFVNWTSTLKPTSQR